MPDYGDEPTDEDGDMSPSLEKMFCRLQFFFIKQEIFPKSPDERFTSIISDSIGNQRSNDASQRAYDDHRLERELLGGDQESCKRHDGFAGYRQDHAFHHHSDEDGDVSGLMDECGDVGGEKFGDAHEERCKGIKGAKFWKE